MKLCRNCGKEIETCPSLACQLKGWVHHAGGRKLHFCDYINANEDVAEPTDESA